MSHISNQDSQPRLACHTPSTNTRISPDRLAIASAFLLSDRSQHDRQTCESYNFSVFLPPSLKNTNYFPHLLLIEVKRGVERGVERHVADVETVGTELMNNR